jgi:hypothetical protein
LSTERPGEALLHPVALAALVLWVANDHWAKAAHGGLVTGKLSDVASLIVFPLIPVAILSLWRRPSRAWILFWIVATGMVMATINLFEPAAWIYRHGLAVAQWPFRAVFSLGLPGHSPVHLTMDPSDLLTLPALLIPWLLANGSDGRTDSAQWQAQWKLMMSGWAGQRVRWPVPTSPNM